MQKKNIEWFVSTWDNESVDQMEDMGICGAIFSCITDLGMLNRLNKTNKPIIISTGISTLEEIDVVLNPNSDLLSIHCIVHIIQ